MAAAWYFALNYLANFFTVPRLRTGGFSPDQLARFGSSPKKTVGPHLPLKAGTQEGATQGEAVGAQEQNSSFRRASEIHEFHIRKIEFGIWNLNSCQQFLATDRFHCVKKVATLRGNSKFEVLEGCRRKQLQDFVGEILQTLCWKVGNSDQGLLLVSSAYPCISHLLQVSMVALNQTKCPHEKLLYNLRCGSVGNLLVSSLVPSSMSCS